MESFGSSHPPAVYENGSPSLLISLLGPFRVVENGRPLPIKSRKIEALLCRLAIQRQVRKLDLTEALWPDERNSPEHLLEVLLHELRKLLQGALNGAFPVIHDNHSYWLNRDAGIAVDIDEFEQWIQSGHRLFESGDHDGACNAYRSAVSLYRGWLCGGDDRHTAMARVDLRNSCARALLRIAERHYETNDLSTALEVAGHLLKEEPLHEGACRIAICCHARMGERALAFRLYQVQAALIERDMQTTSRPETTAVYNLARLDPGLLVRLDLNSIHTLVYPPPPERPSVKGDAARKSPSHGHAGR